MKIQIWIIALIVFLTSCGKKHPCAKENLLPAYVSYADTEIDTIILRRFRPGSNFAQKIDSVMLTSNNCQFYRNADTVILAPLYTANIFNDEYDWQIFNPFDKKTVSVSDMKFQILESRSRGLFGMDPGSVCISPLISYNRDNSIVTSINHAGNYLFIYK
jgi:hypothetical protein